MGTAQAERGIEEAPAVARPRGRLLVVLTVAVVVAGVALRLFLALAYRGVIYPDETYQMTEPAHRLVFGYGITAWEFQQGTRSWLGPGLLLPPTLLWRWLGLDGSDGLGLLRAWVALGSGLGAAAAAVLARRLAGPAAGLLAAALVAFSPVAVVYEIHPLADTVAAPLTVSAVALLTARRRVALAAAAAGVLLVAALALRPQLLPLVLAVALAVVLGSGWSRARPLALGAAGALAADGVLDALTWGTPFAPLWRSVTFNVVDDGASRYGRSPWSSYLIWTLAVAGPVIVVVLVGGLLLACRRPREPGAPRDPVVPAVLVAGVAGFVALLSAIGHKELRFAVPALPLACALAAIGVVRWGSRLPVRPGVAGGTVAAVVAAAGLLVLPGVTKADIGYTGPEPALPMDDVTPRLLSAAGRLPDVCGVVIVSQRLTWSGGYTALHRDVPLGAWRRGGPDVGAWAEWANVVIARTATPLPAGYRPVVVDGDRVVAQRPGGCAEPPPTVARRTI